jgi:PRTRC genetic system ThiF family protein
MTQHKTPARFLSDRRVTVALIGCGGTGSQMLTGLARLNHALVEDGHGPTRHRVRRRQVSAANVGRQMFSPADVGQRKSVVLVHRLNAFFGLDWCGRPVHAGADAIIRGAPDPRCYVRRQRGGSSEIGAGAQ